MVGVAPCVRENVADHRTKRHETYLFDIPGMDENYAFFVKREIVIFTRGHYKNRLGVPSRFLIRLRSRTGTAICSTSLFNKGT